VDTGHAGRATFISLWLGFVIMVGLRVVAFFTMPGGRAKGRSNSRLMPLSSQARG